MKTLLIRVKRALMSGLRWLFMPRRGDVLTSTRVGEDEVKHTYKWEKSRFSNLLSDLWWFTVLTIGVKYAFGTTWLVAIISSFAVYGFLAILFMTVIFVWAYLQAKAENA